MDLMLKPAVADLFYPADAKVLRATIEDFLAKVKLAPTDLVPPKAIIAPHAGYVYSGPVAASAYACLANHRNKIKRVVVVAPAHRWPFYGLAVPLAEKFSMPFGEITIDSKTLQSLHDLPQVKTFDEAFIEEHAVEVHLPFLQFFLQDFLLVPILVGEITTFAVAEVLEKVWGGEETLIVISSDLSHYHPYARAKKLDEETAQAILTLNDESLDSEHACGYLGIAGLLQVARRKRLKAKMLDLRNSGDTAGSKDQVVGYGAFHIY